MNTALWVVQGVLALAFLAAGFRKFALPMPMLAKSTPWTADVPAWQVRGIGLAEILGALGLILPGVTGIAPALTDAAAAGLVVLMIGAAGFHLTRHEGPRTAPSIVLALLALVILVGRVAISPLA